MERNRQESRRYGNGDWGGITLISKLIPSVQEQDGVTIRKALKGREDGGAG